MLDNEIVLHALEKQVRDKQDVTLEPALQELMGNRATDGNGLAIGTVIAIRYPDPLDSSRFITKKLAGGYRDWENNEAVQTDDLFRIYSVTKTFTAAVVMQLEQEGKLHLEDSIYSWIDQIKQNNIEAGHPEHNVIFDKLHIHPLATIRDLLMHRSGIGNYSHDGFRNDANSQPDKKWSAYDTLNYNLTTAENTIYGEFNYSDTGYNVLGLIIEHAGGQSYEQQLKAYIERQRLPNTYADSTASKLQEQGYNLAHGYAANPKEHFRPESSLHYYTSLASGCLLSNADNMLEWASHLYQKQEALLQSHAPVTINKPVPSHCGEAHYGHGIMIQKSDDGHNAYGHGGYARGGRAKVYYYPQSQTSVVTLESYEPITVMIARDLAKKDVTLQDIKQTTLMVRDAYTTDRKFDRAQLYHDWQVNVDTVLSKVKVSTSMLQSHHAAAVPPLTSQNVTPT